MCNSIIVLITKIDPTLQTPMCSEPTWESPPITRLCGRVLVGKASQNSRGAPLGLPEHLPQKKSLPTLLLCALTYTSDFTGGRPPLPISLSEKELTYSSS